MTDIKLVETSITESGGMRFVEMVYADQPDLDQAEQHVLLHIAITAEGHPRLPAAQLEALRIARNVIGGEIQRLEEIRGLMHRNEDW